MPNTVCVACFHKEHARRDIRSDRQEVQAARNAGQPDADKRMRSQTVTAMNQRNDARDMRTSNAGHAVTAQPQSLWIVKRLGKRSPWRGQGRHLPFEGYLACEQADA